MMTRSQIMKDVDRGKNMPTTKKKVNNKIIQLTRKNTVIQQKDKVAWAVRTVKGIFTNSKQIFET